MLVASLQLMRTKTESLVTRAGGRLGSLGTAKVQTYASLDVFLKPLIARPLIPNFSLNLENYLITESQKGRFNKIIRQNIIDIHF